MVPFALGPLPEGYGTGLEWMPVASVLIPFVVLLVLLWLGSRHDV